MCKDVSWIEYKDEVYFLTNLDLETKEGKELLLPNVKNDIKGHGAIINYYPELKDGIHKECVNFSNQKNFPKEIANALKKGIRTKFGIHLEILNKEGIKEFKKIIQPAYADYEKIIQPAYADYEKIIQPAYADYEKIIQPAYADYEKIEQPAWIDYEKIRQPAYADYEKIIQQAYANIVKQKKYRSDNWK